MIVELVKDEDFEKVHKLIEKTCRKSFTSYYPPAFIEKVIASLVPEKLKSRASWTHFYVVKEDDKILGCGAIGPYWDSKTESSIFNVFVDPDTQGKGIGRMIIETLENDYYFKRASRIEIPSGLVAIPFYKKMGYEHKNGELNYSNGHFALEKYNTPSV